MTERATSTEPRTMDIFATSLSPETVGNGEVESLYRIAEQILTENGIESTINGVPSIVSEANAQVKVKGKEYFARVYRQDHEIEGQRSGIVFGETLSNRVVTPNMYALRFGEFAGDIRLMLDNELDPIVNDPELIRDTKEILMGISDSVRDAKARAEQSSAEQARLKKERRSEKLANAKRFAREYGGPIAVCAAILAGTGGAIWGMASIDDGKSFDENQYTLDGGTVLVEGRLLHPEFSTQLLEDEALEVGDILDIDPGGYADDPALSSDDTLRQDTIITSNSPNNCETVVVEEVPNGSEVRAWTDFTNTESGGSRADELTVELRDNNIEICWTGEELDDYDDPRVVLSIVDTTPLG